jgi:two-component sensor histidine kinase
MTACISGWAMMRNEQVVIADIYQDDRIPHEAYRPTGVHSLVMTPVGEDEPFAALGAYWSEVRAPAADEVAVLSALSHCMATALHNIQLVENLQAETRHQQVLINELNHRVKNTLAIIQSIARQSLRGERPLAAAAADFEARLMALSAAHNLITDTFWMSAPMADLIGAALKPFGCGTDEGRFAVEGPDLRLEPRSAVAFALALHELGTNATKYGALSTPTGQVAIRWRVTSGEGGQRLQFFWREAGGPAVAPPKTRGLGSRLIERGLAAELDGTVKLAFPTEGVTCEIDAPLPDQAYSPEELSAPDALPERQRRTMRMFPGAQARG